MGTTTRHSGQQAVLICDEDPSQASLTRHSMEVRNLSKSKESLNNESNKFIKSTKGIHPQTASDLAVPHTIMERTRMSQDSIVLPGYLRTIGTGSSADFQ